MQSQRKKLGAIAEIIPGLTGFEAEGPFKYQVIQPNNLTDTGALEGVTSQFRADPLPEKQQLIPGDILIKRLNPSFVYQVHASTASLTFSQNMFAIRPREGINSSYLAFLLEQPDVLGEIMHVTGKAAVVKAISAKMLNDVEVPVPSMETQQKIGKMWELFRKRRQLLREYLAENEKMESYLASKILYDGGIH